MTNVGSKHYSYDSVGNVIHRDGTTLAYTAFNKPDEIRKGGDTTFFFYDATNTRYQKRTVSANSDRLTTYIGKTYEETIGDGTSTQKNFIYFGSKLIATKINKNTTNYMHSDTQGNIVAISDDSGTIINRRSYTPFGEIRHIAYKEGITCIEYQ